MIGWIAREHVRHWLEKGNVSLPERERLLEALRRVRQQLSKGKQHAAGKQQAISACIFCLQAGLASFGRHDLCIPYIWRIYGSIRFAVHADLKIMSVKQIIMASGHPLRALITNNDDK